ncbi:hypothetical protein L8106_22376 [Lyngbya sp. PCC 8106]|nr:hypothetical protein L8106_22681 [Lyngbya sp. PCC 8106]EAW35847.1 hypothetical protein L8106_02692 [Lyngbya sp. PCC 8106]EAW35989.1 hypothetical protein L8106_22376 [Lyngbya sp. PCC 8106]
MKPECLPLVAAQVIVDRHVIER